MANNTSVHAHMALFSSAVFPTPSALILVTTSEEWRPRWGNQLRSYQQVGPILLGKRLWSNTTSRSQYAVAARMKPFMVVATMRARVAWCCLPSRGRA